MPRRTGDEAPGYNADIPCLHGREGGEVCLNRVALISRICLGGHRAKRNEIDTVRGIVVFNLLRKKDPAPDSCHVG